MPLLITMLAMTLLAGLGAALVVGTMTETAVAAAYGQASAAFYAADAAIEFAIRDLAMQADWDEVLSGAQTSMLVDGAPAGSRHIGVTVIDLERATGEVEALLAARAAPPAGPPRLYAFGRFDDLIAPIEAEAAAYLCVWVAEQPPEGQADPPVRLLYVVGRAFGPTGGRRTVLVTMARPLDPDELAPIQVRSWEEPD